MSCQIGQECGCNLKNTGMAYPETWDHIHGLIDKEIGCEECNVHGHERISGEREHIALGIGKTVHDKAAYDAWFAETVCVHDKCKREGRC